MRAKTILYISLVAVAALTLFARWPRGGAVIGGFGRPSSTQPATQPGAADRLVLYCAAGLRKPVEAAVADYARETGVQVQLQFGGSQTLLTNLQLSQTGDLYLPADGSYLDLARSRDLVAESAPVATMRPVVAVKRGNPKNIRTLDDLLRPDVKIALADPGAAAVGKLTRDALAKAGRWEPIERKQTVTHATVNEVATAVQLGTVDAGFVWDALVRQMPGGVEAVDVPELAGASAGVGVAVLKSAKDPTAALRFLRYLSARDRGLPHFVKEGFTVGDGDAWADRPRVLLYSGAMLQPAIEDTIADFERREGCQVDRVYNGCGILVGQMKVGQRPDAYFACDKAFLEQVKDLFVDAHDVSMNQLVILTKKGNPHGVRELKDLAKPGLRVGVGHEKQCALGALTQETFRQSGTEKIVRKNVVVESPTGDLLVNQLLTGSLDACVAYVSNAAGHADELEAIRIDIPCALAVQPVAVGRESKHRQLTGRLMDALRSAQSRERFEAYGFRWQDK